MDSNHQYFLSNIASNMLTSTQYPYRNNLHTIVPNNMTQMDPTKIAGNLSFNGYSNIDNENGNLSLLFGGSKQKKKCRPKNANEITANKLTILVQEVMPAQTLDSRHMPASLSAPFNDTVGTVINEVLAKAVSRQAHDDVFPGLHQNQNSDLRVAHISHKRMASDPLTTVNLKRPRLVAPPDFRLLVHEPSIISKPTSILPPIGLSSFNHQHKRVDDRQLADNCVKYRRAPFALLQPRFSCQDRFIVQNINANLPTSSLLAPQSRIDHLDLFVPASPASSPRSRSHSPTFDLVQRCPRKIASPIVDSETGETVQPSLLSEHNLFYCEEDFQDQPIYSEKVFKCLKESQEENGGDQVVVVVSKSKQSHQKIVRIKPAFKPTASHSRPSKYHKFRTSTVTKSTAFDAHISGPEFLSLSCEVRAVRRRPSIVDLRTCLTCSKKGDLPNGEGGRLLFVDVDKWVHLKCILSLQVPSEASLIASALNSEHVLRVGSLELLQIGQLRPSQILGGHFHNLQHVYPVGFTSRRIHWSSRVANNRAVYTNEILASADGERPLFKVTTSDDGLPDKSYWGGDCSFVWRQILAKIATCRSRFTDRIVDGGVCGEQLFGLTEACILRAVESLPGLQGLRDYAFKYGKMQLIAQMPPPKCASGCARTEPYQRVRTRPVVHQSPSFARYSLPIPADVPVTSANKWQQYRRLRSEWRSNVVLKRSRIEGLGLFAARDLDKGTMVIEYVGELIRNEVANRREREYQRRKQGVYMFRLDEGTVIDATKAGDLARYVNHCCQPNCFTEVIESERESHIVIVANRHIERNEELNYDYKFDLEEDGGEERLACLCGASNCHRWMN